MIAEILLHGVENAQSARDLCAILEIDARVLSQAVERERRAGSPICATSSRQNPGYYLAADKKEMAEYCNRLRHRAGEIFATRKACMNTIDKLPESEEAM